MRNLSNNAFDKPCVKPSSLEFCHDEKEWQENVPVRACSLSGNSNKVRYPEEIPKAYRRKGNKTEEDKRGQKTRGEDGRREEAFITKSALLPLQDWRTNKTKGLMQIKIGGG